MDVEVAIRPATSADAEAMIDLHHAAVHRCASGFYSDDVLDTWSPPPGHARYEQLSRRDVITDP